MLKNEIKDYIINPIIVSAEAIKDNQIDSMDLIREAFLNNQELTPRNNNIKVNLGNLCYLLGIEIINIIDFPLKLMELRVEP